VFSAHRPVGLYLKAVASRQQPGTPVASGFTETGNGFGSLGVITEEKSRTL